MCGRRGDANSTARLAQYRIRAHSTRLPLAGKPGRRGRISAIVSGSIPCRPQRPTSSCRSRESGPGPAHGSSPRSLTSADSPSQATSRPRSASPRHLPIRQLDQRRDPQPAWQPPTQDRHARSLHQPAQAARNFLPHPRPPLPNPFTRLLRRRRRHRRGARLHPVNPGVAWTAGGMVSTFDDLPIWGRVLARGRLLSKRLQPRQLRFGSIPTPAVRSRSDPGSASSNSDAGSGATARLTDQHLTLSLPGTGAQFVRHSQPVDELLHPDHRRGRTDRRATLPGLDLTHLLPRGSRGSRRLAP
jgi:hypothetical protein